MDLEDEKVCLWWQSERPASHSLNFLQVDRTSRPNFVDERIRLADLLTRSRVLLAYNSSSTKTGRNEMQLTELMEAVDLLRKAGWTVEPPKRRGSPSSLSKPKRDGRAPKSGRRKRGRPRKSEVEA
jgi:hypothetical protein